MRIKPIASDVQRSHDCPVMFALPAKRPQKIHKLDDRSGRMPQETLLDTPMLTLTTQE